MTPLSRALLLPHPPRSGVAADITAGRVALTLSWQLRSTPNLREHWGVTAKRARRLRSALHLAWPAPARGLLRRGVWPCCLVTLTRYGPRLLDADNLQGAFKSLVDSVAFELVAPPDATVRGIGQWDSDARLAWLYRQEKSSEYAVRIELERREGA